MMVDMMMGCAVVFHSRLRLIGLDSDVNDRFAKGTDMSHPLIPEIPFTFVQMQREATGTPSAR